MCLTRLVSEVGILIPNQLASELSFGRQRYEHTTKSNPKVSAFLIYIRKDIFSPASGGSVNPVSVRTVIRMQGKMRLNAEKTWWCAIHIITLQIQDTIIENSSTNDKCEDDVIVGLRATLVVLDISCHEGVWKGKKIIISNQEFHRVAR